MKVLVIGSGGREHAIVWKISQSRRVEKVFCAPGNGGISEYADCLDIGVLDTEAIVKACKEKNIDLVVVAPDDPLAIGMVNELAKAGIRAFGPTREAALIESSKSFAKNLMKNTAYPLRNLKHSAIWIKRWNILSTESIPLL